MSDTMKTLIIREAGRAEVVRVPIPRPGPGQALVRVAAVTTCPQWDLHIYAGQPMFAHQHEVPFPYPPGQPGHEMTGTVAEAGPGCLLTPGTAVCAWKDPGHHRPGCYAEYVVMEEEHLLPVPADIPYARLASLELAMCVASSILRLKSFTGIAGKRCIVNGLGPAGLIALQMLAAEGAGELIGVDPNAARRESALRLGAARGLPAGSEELPRRTDPEAAELAVDCVGYPQAVAYAMDRTREAVALFAVQREDYTLRHPGLTVVGYPGHHRAAADYALRLVRDGLLDLSPLITRELPLERYAEAVELLRSQQAIKIAFIPSRSE